MRIKVSERELLEFRTQIKFKDGEVRPLAATRNWDRVWFTIHWNSVQQTVYHKQLRIFQLVKSTEVESGIACSVELGELELITTPAAKLWAVRRVAHDSRGQRTGGVDGTSLDYRSS